MGFSQLKHTSSSAWCRLSKTSRPKKRLSMMPHLVLASRSPAGAKVLSH